MAKFCPILFLERDLLVLLKCKPVLVLFYHFRLNFDCGLALFDVGVVGLWRHMETT